jgi:glycosyltransferase involved in cell wall biosynthesis
VHPAGDAAGYGTEPERNGDSLRLTDENGSVPKSRRRETTQRGRFKLLSVGTLIPRKNLEVVIRAVAELSYCDLVIVGDESVDPKYAGRIRRMVAERALSDRIIMRGRVPTDVLEREYRSADLFVAPSKYEGFGIVYLESLSRGVPVIASGAGGAQEVVRDGTDGYVVSPDRPAEVVGAIDRLYEDPDTLTAMRESALERAEMFHDWRRTMRGAVRFLEVVGSRGHETQRKTRS